MLVGTGAAVASAIEVVVVAAIGDFPVVFIVVKEASNLVKVYIEISSSGVSYCGMVFTKQ